jgi:hypothetical protein
MGFNDRKTLQWNSTFLRLPLIREGATEKASQLLMPLKSIYSKDFHFSELKCIFEQCRKVQTITNLHNNI